MFLLKHIFGFPFLGCLVQPAPRPNVFNLFRNVSAVGLHSKSEIPDKKVFLNFRREIASLVRDSVYGSIYGILYIYVHIHCIVVYMYISQWIPSTYSVKLLHCWVYAISIGFGLPIP